MKEESKRAMKDCGSLFWAFFKMGLFTIGGGMAMLPLIEATVVEKHKWMNREEMIDCLAVSQALPGVIAVNSATYIGNHKRGIKGAVSATLGVILPSFIIILIAVAILGAVGTNRYVEGAFTGVKAAVCGLVAVVTFRLGRQVFRGPFQWISAALAFAGIAVFRLNAVWSVILGALAGILYVLAKPKKGEKE